jgi:nitroreductase
MDNLELLLTRRSIRRYKQEPIKKQIIIKLLRAGMAAPSAFNQQPWEFVVIQDKELLKKIANLHHYASMAKYAAGCIVICANPEKDKRSLDMWPQDCAASTENVLLAAHGFGLGAVWIGIYPNDEYMNVFRNVCKIPSEMIPFSGVCFGVADAKKPSANRFDESRIHWDSW